MLGVIVQNVFSADKSNAIYFFKHRGVLLHQGLPTKGSGSEGRHATLRCCTCVHFSQAAAGYGC